MEPDDDDLLAWWRQRLINAGLDPDRGLYDRDGNPITWDVHARLANDPETQEYRQVARTKIGANVVSTVWLGFDTSFGRAGRPLIFETLVLGPDGEEGQRYCTEAEALAGHEEFVTLLRATE